MSTSTIRLPDESKARVARVDAAAGMTAHGCIVEALAAQAAEAETWSQRDGEVGARRARFCESGAAIRWSQLRRDIVDKAAHRPVRRPRARKLGTPKAVARRA